MTIQCKAQRYPSCLYRIIVLVSRTLSLSYVITISDSVIHCYLTHEDRSLIRYAFNQQLLQSFILSTLTFNLHFLMIVVLTASEGGHHIAMRYQRVTQSLSVYYYLALFTKMRRRQHSFSYFVLYFFKFTISVSPLIGTIFSHWGVGMRYWHSFWLG